MPFAQLTCPNCGTVDLKGSTLVETAIEVSNLIVSNPKSGIMKVRRGSHEYTEGTEAVLVCARCGVQSPLEQLSTVNYDIAKK